MTATTTKRAIVEVARELMREKGYAGMSMQDIANRVGLLKGSLYSHFRNKEALVSAVLDLTLEEMAESAVCSGDWRRDYEVLLDRLSSDFCENKRCLGFHLAYGLDTHKEDQKKAVKQFFESLVGMFSGILMQGLDEDIASEFARETVTEMEGATLWLALDGNDAPILAIKMRLLRRADGFAEPLDDDKVRRLLGQLVTDWRRASLAEKRLAMQLVDREAELLDALSAVVGNASAQSCFI